MPRSGEAIGVVVDVVLFAAKYVGVCCDGVGCDIFELFFFFIAERREQELNKSPEWKKFWKKLQKRDKPEMREKLEWERHFLQVSR